MTNSSHTHDSTAAGIVRKRRELVDLRLDLYRQIKALDKAVALLDAALQVFDEGSRVYQKAKAVKAKRSPRTRRFVFDVMRDAGEPLTAIQIAQRWIANTGAEATPENQRLYRSRVSSALQASRTQGLVACEPGPDQALWRLVDNA